MKVLDNGSVELVESWGSDERIIETARVSTQKGFKGWGDAENPGDEKLLRYLWEHKHSTPFEFAGATFEVQAPIFVVREWHRHRTFSYSEASARYAPLPDLNYVPSVERLMMRAIGNKQAAAVGGELKYASVIIESLKDAYDTLQKIYQQYLDMGVPKELARLVLPVGRYTRMRAQANLRNWLAFLTLREDEAAQWEIRQYANAIHAKLSEVFPRTMALYEETRGK